MRYLHDIYNLKHITRYSTIHTISKESVAEHGFFVAAIVLDLYSRYDFDLGKAITLAIVHDMPELELNDCNHMIKAKYPAIKEAFDACEEEVAKLFYPWIREAIEEYNTGHTREAKIVRLADVIQCSQYAEVEQNLGNHGYMDVVYQRSAIRSKELIEELTEYER